MKNLKIKKPKIKKPEKKIFFVIRVLVKIFYFLILLGFLATFYFLVLISVKPRSFPFVTKKIEAYVNDILPYGSTAKISKISIGLDEIYVFKVALDGVQVNFEGKTISLPEIEAEFLPTNIIFYQKPSKVSINGARIELTSTKASDNTTKTSSDSSKKYIEKVWISFLFIKYRDIVTKEFEVNNLELLFTDKKANKKKVSIKHSKINIWETGSNFHVSAQNIFNFYENGVDIKFDANCQFDEDKYLKCKTNFLNIIPEKFANISKETEFLSEIKTEVNANFNIEINPSHEITSLLFDIKAKNGSFYYPSLFVDKIDFSDLLASGEIKNNFKDIKISKLETNFDKNIKFSTSVDITNFNDPNQEVLDMNFKISNTPTEKITKFWPIFLDPSIRIWIKDHISKGVINSAYANVRMSKKQNDYQVDDVNSEILFSGATLNYSSDMPEIKKIDGIATFNTNSMKINLISGEVLNSKIKLGKITIDDFKAKQILLKITGLASGNTIDAIRHINYKSNFFKTADQYINGFADSSFDIQLPIKDNISLHEIYLKISSNISKINNQYFTNNSSISAGTIKEFNSDNFKTNINFLDSTLNIPMINISKDKKIQSLASLDILVTDDFLHLDNVTWNIGNSRLTADAVFNLEEFDLIKLDVSKNLKNSYNIRYKLNPNHSLITLDVSGNYLNLEPLINNLKNLNSSSDDTNYDSIIIRANLQKVKMANNRIIEDLNVSLNCSKKLCKEGFISSKMNDKNFVNITLSEPNKDDNSNDIGGKINDISSLARALNISDQILDGNSKIKGKLSINDGKINIRNGSLEISDGFSVIKNKIFNQIIKEKTFDDLRKDLARSDKISFDKLNLEFELNDNILKINKMVAGSYLIGFTAKGEIDLSGPEIKLKGLIIPGYFINKLFGISDIPVIGTLITGESGGGIFAARYEYSKKKDQQEGDFKINATSAIIPGSIRNIFDLFE